MPLYKPLFENYTAINQKKAYICSSKPEVKKGTGVPFFIRYDRQMEKPDLLELVGTAVSELKLDDVYPVDVLVSNSRIEVFLDSDDGITFQKCQLISRWLEAIFDVDKRYGEHYVLEVSSAGVGKPLKLLRQYAKNIGRLIDIRHKGDQRTRGTLSAVDGHLITVSFDEKVKEGKKNKIVKRQEIIPFEDIIEAKIKLSF